MLCHTGSVLLRSHKHPQTPVLQKLRTCHCHPALQGQLQQDLFGCSVSSILFLAQLPEAGLKEDKERSEYKDLRKWSQDTQLLESPSRCESATPAAQSRRPGDNDCCCLSKNTSKIFWPERLWWDLCAYCGINLDSFHHNKNCVSSQILSSRFPL